MNSDSTYEVTVFIATTAERKRKSSIHNAIESVQTQRNVNVKLVVIINGNKFDDDLKKQLMNRSDIECHYLLLGSFPEALKYARTIVDTNYFCFLDDDDELLPNSLIVRSKVLDENPSIDVVVGSGFKKYDENIELETHPEITSYKKIPLEVLYRPMGNWLASCAGMYRTSAIPQEYFDDYATYAEWTYIAFKLALKKNIMFIDDLCYRVKVSSSSLSHNKNYLWGQYSLIDKILLLPLPHWARKLSFIKKREIEHDLAERYIKEKKYKKAWEFHIKSLKSYKTFFRYFLYTRYFFTNLTS